MGGGDHKVLCCIGVGNRLLEVDGARVHIIEESLDVRALGVKVPELLFQFCASSRDAGDCTVSEDML